MADIETMVVGAGVIGLSVAYSLAQRGQRVLVIERNLRAGLEVSQRSSEVVHAGLYYPPGSLKAKLCRQGNDMLRQFARETAIPLQMYGKLLVATREAELVQLERIAANAQANAVEGLIRLSTEEARALEPQLTCAAALFSPSTGVVDSRALTSALEGHIEALGGEIVFGVEMISLQSPSQGTLTVGIRSANTETMLTCQRLVLAGGLNASRLGAMIPAQLEYRVPQTYYAKGHYFALHGKAPFQHLIYPMPRKGGLGIHLTLDVGGAARFGPDIEWRDTISYNFEDENGARRNAFEAEVRAYWPALPIDGLVPAYTGIRPKLTREGESAADFAIHGPKHHGVENLIALYGLDSPGLTASLAVGSHVAENLFAN